MIALVGLLSLVAARPTAGSLPAAANSTSCPDSAERRLVLASLYGINWSILSGVPSGEISVFLGSTLRTRWDRWGRPRRSALGYEISGSAGGADYFTAFYSWGGDYGIAYHRHHLAALGYAAKNNRLYYHVGGGLLLWRTAPLALEADVRLGLVLGIRRKSRIRGVVGGQARIVGVIGGVPLPQFGVFAGLLVF